MNKKNEEDQFNIKLKRWQLEYLLQAARLGMHLEDLCDSLAQAGIGTCESDGTKWLIQINVIISEIRKQTGVEPEYELSRYCAGPIRWLQNFVDEECIKLDKNLGEWEREQYENMKQDPKNMQPSRKSRVK